MNSVRQASNSELIRKRIELTGALQGIGLRPSIYRQAVRLQLQGFVRNHGLGVSICVQGLKARVDTFTDGLARLTPLLGRDYQCDIKTLQLEPDRAGFVIEDSVEKLSLKNHIAPVIQPDCAPCSDCIEEMLDPTDKRYHYPFTACAHCGPRFSVTGGVPFDRSRTSFGSFPLCNSCQKEYETPSERRFHAQTISCPVCGPRISLFDHFGKKLVVDESGIFIELAELLKAGEVIAVKTYHGFQLLADPTQLRSIKALRAFKKRPSKPFALMYPNLEDIEEICYVSEREKLSLQSDIAPILLLSLKTNSASYLDWCAPNLSRLGCMLPTSAFFHCLFSFFSGPVLVTSGNLPGMPLCSDFAAALAQLSAVASYFVDHDLTIQQALDDSVVQCVGDDSQVLRRSRGYVPTLVSHALPYDGACRIGYGGDMKACFSIAISNMLYLSQPFGEWHNLHVSERLSASQHLLEKGFIQSQVSFICADLHPGYVSTQWAEAMSVKQGKPLNLIQHHEAHFFATMTEYRLNSETLGFIWDGAGYGSDGKIWGGECFVYTPMNRRNRIGMSRVASFLPFSLLGGDQAAREPFRVALGLIETINRDPDIAITTADISDCLNISRSTLKELNALYGKGIAFPQTTSVGRLFDAAAALVGICQLNTYEGEAAIKLMELAMTSSEQIGYPFLIKGKQANDQASLLIIDWRPAFLSLILDVKQRVPAAQIARRFHQGLANLVVDLCVELLRNNLEHVSFENILFSGGVWQNTLLLSLTRRAIMKNPLVSHINFCPALALPPGDASLALGQVVAAGLVLNEQTPGGCTNSMKRENTCV